MLAAVALGANLPSRFGDPRANLREAVHRLGDLGRVRTISSLVETEPVGFLDQPRFVNGALLLETWLDPLSLLRGLLEVERGMGRERSADTPPKGPRVIDLDLLLVQGKDGQTLTLEDPELTLPHPEMHKRLFVLDSLAEIAPEWVHPGLGETVGALAAALRVEAGAEKADSLRE